MGNEVIVLAVDVANNGTLLQVDFKTDTGRDRMFIEMRSIYKALNNYAYLKNDDELIKMGFELEDPEHYINPNLID